MTKPSFYVLLTSLVLTFGLAVTACEGPAGTEGAVGSKGPAGPVGPAGEDGSQMYAGQGEPSADVGEPGDFYLDQDTGELYGPKAADDWGGPGIVLMGEDGQDGVDGQDGSQIYSGTGAPDVELGVEGDYYLDTDSYDLYGPKTSSGWESPLNLKGADGNANVTRYIFTGADFQTTNPMTKSISGLEGEAEMRQSAWLVYLVYEMTDGRLVYYALPGLARNPDEMYKVQHTWYDNTGRVGIGLYCTTNCGTYDLIEVIQIEAGNTVSPIQAKITPDHLDVSDYQAVAEYYGFYK